MSLSRRDLLRVTAPAAMATTFLPLAGRWRTWAHPAEKKLATRALGRTGREVTTFGLAGGNKVMWELPGDEGVEIIVRAVRSGITYLETANNYYRSQLNYGKAFRILKLIPGEPGYDASLRARLFVATKSHLRTAIARGGAKPYNTARSGLTLVVDEVMRALTQMFGDGKGYVPEGAYLDLFQVHSLRTEADVDAAFEGFENPSDTSLPRLGAMAALVDLRDGTNRTGLNPGHKKLIRHVGITGHENPTAHMYAMRRDRKNDLETLLVVVNPNDRHYFCHETNSIPVAAAKGMGIIGMKIFADGVFYGLPKTYASQPGQSVPTVGQPGKVAPEDFLRYSLSVPGVSTLITGIGSFDQLNYNLAACQQTDPLPADKRRDIEARTAALHGTDTNFFQRPGSGLVAPQGVHAQRQPGGSAVELSWSTAYAGGDPVVSYEIWRRDQKLATVPFQPQVTEAQPRYVDTGAPTAHAGGLWYRVRAVDASGKTADSLSVKPE